MFLRRAICGFKAREWNGRFFIKRARADYRSGGISVEWQIDFGKARVACKSREIAVGTAVYAKDPRRPFPVFFMPSGKRNPRKLKIPAFSSGLKRSETSEGTWRRATLPVGTRLDAVPFTETPSKGLCHYALEFRCAWQDGRSPSSSLFLSLFLSAAKDKVACECTLVTATLPAAKCGGHSPCLRRK